MLVAVALAVAVVLAASIAASVTWPKVWLRNAVTHGKLSSRVFTQTFWVQNTGGTSLTIRGVDSGGPGVEMVGSNLDHAVTVPTGRVVRIVTTYRVTDCRDPVETVPLQLRTDQWWGIKTITVQDYGTDFDGAYTACIDVTN